MSDGPTINAEKNDKNTKDLLSNKICFVTNPTPTAIIYVKNMMIVVEAIFKFFWNSKSKIFFFIVFILVPHRKCKRNDTCYARNTSTYEYCI